MELYSLGGGITPPYASIHLLHAITRTANEAATVDAALAESVAQIADFMHWPIGHAYVLDRSTRKMVSTSFWSVNMPGAGEFRKASEGLQFSGGEGLPGRVLSSGRAVWVADVTDDPTFTRTQLAKEAALKAAMCFPVLAGKDAVAALEFFSQEAGEPDETLLGLMSDIGVQLGRLIERVHATEALQRYVSEVDDLYNNVPAGYHSLDKSGIFVRINDTELRWLGYQREEVVGKMNLANILTPEGVQLFRESFPRFMQDGAIYDLELQYVRKDGNKFPVLLSATAMKDAAGHFQMSRAVVYDISDRKRLENNLRESEERFRQFFEQAPLAIGLFSPHQNRHFLMVNERMVILTGRSAEELSQINLAGITHHDDRKNDEVMMAGLFTGEIPAFTFEKRLVHRDGTGLWANVVTTAVRNAQAELIYGLVIIEDITQRKHTEQELLRVVRELEEALHSVKTLNGLLPICAWCKKIRDDTGYWSEVETYVKTHTSAEFTHGICPACVDKHAPR